MMVKLILIMASVLLPFTGMSQANLDMKKIKGGTFIPLYSSYSSGVFINDFWLDVYPVTNQQYFDFVKKDSKWRKSKALRIFADENYLSTWENDTSLGPNILPQAAITTISWFAAKAYCANKNKRLPGMDEWEYAAMASETKPNAQQDSIFNRKIIEGYEIQGKSVLNGQQFLSKLII